MQNGIRMLDKDRNLIKTSEQVEDTGHGGVDHENTGEKGYNYCSEHFFNKLKQVSVIRRFLVRKYTATQQHHYLGNIQVNVS